MRCSDDVNYHREKQELRNKWTQNWDWDEGTQTGLCSHEHVLVFIPYTTYNENHKAIKEENIQKKIPLN